MRRFFLIILILISSFLLSGCWNYREIEKLAIVAGVSVDRGEDEKLKMTVEIVNISSGEKGGEINPVYVDMDGDTFFDAVRGAVSLSGKKLYWGHCKVLVLSKEVASKEVNRVLDFVMRDSEIREDMWLVVSKEKTAKEIIQSATLLEKILSFELDNALRSQKTVARFPSVELYKFVNKLSQNKDAPFLPAAKIVETKEGKTFKMDGTAIFKKNNLTGWLDEMDSKFLLTVRNELKGGLFIINKAAGTDTNVTLEIYRNKTEIKPSVSEGNIRFDISIKPIVYIAELEGSKDFISEKGREALRKDAEKKIKADIEQFIKKVQKEYKVDIFGFGRKLEIRYPNVWKGVKDDWEELFPEIEANVSVEIKILGSAVSRKPIMTGE